MSSQTHPERQDWDESRLLLSISCPRFTAYCSPEATGEVFVDDSRVSRKDYKLNPQRDAPFPFDIVFHDVYPHEGEVEPLNEYLAEVYERISQSGDPLGTIMNEMEPEDVAGAP